MVTTSKLASSKGRSSPLPRDELRAGRHRPGDLERILAQVEADDPHGAERERLPGIPPDRTADVEHLGPFDIGQARAEQRAAAQLEIGRGGFVPPWQHALEPVEEHPARSYGETASGPV